MQTGNTIFVGLGTSNQSPCPYGWARSLTANGCFVLGSYVFSRLNNILGPRGRGSLILSFSIQAIMLSLTACLIQTDVIAGIPTSKMAGAAGADIIDWTQQAAIVCLVSSPLGRLWQVGHWGLMRFLLLSLPVYCVIWYLMPSCWLGGMGSEIAGLLLFV